MADSHLHDTAGDTDQRVSLINPAALPRAEVDPPRPRRTNTHHSDLRSQASAKARLAHAEFATAYTAGRLAAWEDPPCYLVSPAYTGAPEKAAEWQRGFRDGWGERVLLGAGGVV